MHEVSSCTFQRPYDNAQIECKCKLTKHKQIKKLISVTNWITHTQLLEKMLPSEKTQPNSETLQAAKGDSGSCSQEMLNMVDRWLGHACCSTQNNIHLSSFSNTPKDS